MVSSSIFSSGRSGGKFSGAEEYEIVYPQKLHAMHRRAAGTSSEVGEERRTFPEGIWEMGKDSWT